jgi:hypothetical protein
MKQEFIKNPWNTYLKKNQMDAKFIFSLFGQTPLHVLGVSTTYSYVFLITNLKHNSFIL